MITAIFALAIIALILENIGTIIIWAIIIFLLLGGLVWILVKLTTPKFMMEKKKLTGAEKGTIMHMCLQKLNENHKYELEDIKNMMVNMVLKNILTQQEANSIDIEILYDFTKTSLWQDIKKAKAVYKEQPFYICLPANEIYDSNSKENVLVQGIIDLYYINEKDELILVDYKTDYVESKQDKELIEKYKKQLELYAQALEQALNKKVNKKCIYSTYLNRVIEI